MPWQGHDLGQDLFSAELDTSGYVGLIWYSFRLETLSGRTQDLGPYQLTVYDGEEDIPAWFGEGTTYQIFPDRFCRSRVPDPEGMVGCNLTLQFYLYWWELANSSGHCG